MKLRTALSYILMFSLLALLTACGSGGGAGTANGVKTSINFANKASIDRIHYIEVVAVPFNGGQEIWPENGKGWDPESSPNKATLNLSPNEKYLIRVIAIDDSNKNKVIYSGQKVFEYTGSEQEVTINCYSMDGFDGVEKLYKDSNEKLNASTQDGNMFGLSFNTHEGWLSGKDETNGFFLDAYLAASSVSGEFDMFVITTDSVSQAVESTATGTMNANTGAASGTGIDHTDHDKSFNWWFKPFVNQPHP